MCLTHGPSLAEDSQHEVCFQQEKYDEKYEGHELVHGVQSVRLVWSVQRAFPFLGEAETSVERDVSGAGEERDRRKEDEAERHGGSVLEYLVADGAIEEKHPERCNNSPDVDGGKGLDKVSKWSWVVYCSRRYAPFVRRR